MKHFDLVVQGKILGTEETERIASMAGCGRWTARGGCTRFFSSSISADERQQLMAGIHDLGCDAAFVAAGLRLSDFRAVFFDMDSTLASTETLDEIAALLGVGEACARITSDSMHGRLRDYAESLRRRTELLRGMDAGVIERVWEETRPNPGVEKWLKTVHSLGLKTYIVSSGFTVFTERMCRRLGMTGACSNVIEIVDGKFTGGVSGMNGGPVLDAAGKAEFVRRTMESLGATPAQSICCGDGSNDVKMVSAAGFGVGFRPKAVLRPYCTAVLDVLGFDSLVNCFVDTTPK